MGNSSLGHLPSGRHWEVDTSVAAVSDDKVTRSIPQYEVMRHAVIEHGLRILEDIHAALLPGGAFIFVEKVIGATAALDRDFVALYHEFKRAGGYTSEEIERKRLSLEGVLVPVTARWNEELLKTAGFRQTDCFWRWMNFAGWIAVKS